MSARGVLLFSSAVVTLRWDGIKCFLGLRKVCSEDFVVWGGKRIPPSGFFGYGRHLLRHVSKHGFKGVWKREFGHM